MKHLYKLITSAFCLIAAYQINAQTFPQSFEGGTFPPTGWASFNNGIGTANDWTSSTFTAQAGVQSAYVQYENVTTGTAEDWLVAPAVAITATSSILSFWEKESFTTDWLSIYNILVSTSSQTNTATFTLVTTYPENMSNPLDFRNRIVNLSAYIGQTVYIAFRMDNDDGDDWYLDNIQLTGGCTTPPFAGAVTGTATTNFGATNSYSVSPVTGNIQWIRANSPAGPWTAIAGATATPQNITAAVGGTMYLRVVASSTAAGCLQDTSNTAHAVVVNFPGDNTCNAIPLTIGPSGTYYQFMGASVQPGEVAPAAGNCTTQATWCLNTLDNTRWFTFVAPPSGHVTIQAPDFDTQLAVWKASSCGSLLTASGYTFICANDDDPNYTANGGVMYSSFLSAACLTPGATYYIQADSYSPATPADSTRIIITTVTSTLDASFSGLSSNYCLPTTTTANLTGTTPGGIFTVNSSTASISNFDPTVAGVGTHTVTYSISGCKSSSTTAVSNMPTVVAVSSNSLICVGQTATLNVTGTASSYTWSTGSTSMSIVVSPTTTTTYSVMGTAAGCSSVTAVVQNVSACTSIQETGWSSSLNVYPNPNEGTFHVSASVIADEISMTDLLGKKVFTVKPATYNTLVEVKQLPQGIYFVHIKVNGSSHIAKIIKE